MESGNRTWILNPIALQVQLLAKELPHSQQGRDWGLVYSTYRDGTSLNTLVRNSAEQGGPCVLVVKDSNGRCFGGYSSYPFARVAAYRHSGTGESFVYFFEDKDTLNVYSWTGERRVCYRILKSYYDWIKHIFQRSG